VEVMNSLEFSLKAVEDLEETLTYISRDKPIAALNFVSKLKEKCRMLAQFPELGMRRDDITAGILVFAVAGYGIYYRQLGNLVRIERVLHGARDPKRAW
jgi:toxin ParE1/3/4